MDSTTQAGSTALALARHPKLKVRQRRELAEWFGFETRNKYEVADQDDRPVAFAAEQAKSAFAFLLRQVLGHWRTFEILVFTPDHQEALVVRHPFRWLFQRLEVATAAGVPVGAIQQRFSFFTKRFDVLDAGGRVVMQVASPIWKLWTFPFTRGGREVASVKKKWSGLLSEAFTDRDNFLVEFDPALGEDERRLVLAAALFIDLSYFERKASNS